MRERGIKRAEILKTLREDILSGRYSAGCAFPSEIALSRRFGVSRTTMAFVMHELEALGLVSRHRGAGTFVTKQGASRKIGLVVPGVAYSEFYPPFLSEMNRLANENGYTLLLGEVYSKDPRARVKQVQSLAKRFIAEGATGIVYQPFEFLSNSDRINRNILATFSACKIPVVLVAADIVPSPDRSEYDVVGINDFEAGRRLAFHLRDVGVRRVAFLLNAYSNYSVQNRLIGVRSVFGSSRELSELYFDPTDESSVRRLFRGKAHPEAIICRSDATASRLLVSLRKIGKRVPGDILLAGFNDINYASMLELTSVRVPSAEIANLAFGQLLDRMTHPDSVPRSQMLPAPLTIRRSTRRV